LKNFHFFPRISIFFKKFTIVLENFAKSRGQFNETRKKKHARFVRSSHRGYKKCFLGHRAHPDEIAEAASHGAGREHRELFFLIKDYTDL
jgi:hypothetical protein